MDLPISFTRFDRTFGVTRAVANFYPLTGEGHRKNWGVFKVSSCDIAGRLFLQSGGFGLKLSFSLQRVNIRIRHGGKNCMNAERSNIPPHTSLAVIRLSK